MPTPGTSTTLPVSQGDSHAFILLLRSSLPLRNRPKKERFSQDLWGNTSADQIQGERGERRGGSLQNVDLQEGLSLGGLDEDRGNIRGVAGAWGRPPGASLPLCQGKG